jgi:hypothetical protein
MSTSFEPKSDGNFCLDITWYQILPSELYLVIHSDTTTEVSRSYNSTNFEFDWKTRLIEDLPFNIKYYVTFRFKSLGGIEDVSFCTKRGIFFIYKIFIDF